MRTKAIIILITTCLLAACTMPLRPKLESFPRQEAYFQRCPDELRKQYADIARYEGSSSRYFFQSHSTRPAMDILIEEWGKPAGKRISWWLLEVPVVNTALGAAFGMSVPSIAGFTAFIWTTLPYTVYTWEKGDYTVKCVAMNPMADGYNPSLQYWTWTYKGPECGKQEPAEVAEKEEARQK